MTLLIARKLLADEAGLAQVLCLKSTIQIVTGSEKPAIELAWRDSERRLRVDDTATPETLRFQHHADVATGAPLAGARTRQELIIAPPARHAHQADATHRRRSTPTPSPARGWVRRVSFPRATRPCSALRPTATVAAWTKSPSPSATSAPSTSPPRSPPPAGTSTPRSARTSTSPRAA